MIFRLITLISVLGLTGRLTYRRFRAAASRPGRSGLARLGDYFSWLGKSAGRLVLPEGRRRLASEYETRVSRYPEEPLRWAFICLTASFAYLAASGFAFAVFSPRGLFGIPLLFHVVAGGIFALSLAVFLFFRAKEHAAVSDLTEAGSSSLKSVLKNPPRRLISSVLFWLFVLSGLSLTVTALGSMLPYFSFDTQVGLVVTHRYSALISVLAAIVFLDLAFHPERR
jgi:hypothetical protein